MGGREDETVRREGGREGAQRSTVASAACFASLSIHPLTLREERAGRLPLWRAVILL